MVLFSYSLIYRSQRLSARITRGIFVANYKGKADILKSKQAAKVVFTKVLCSYTQQKRQFFIIIVVVSKFKECVS